MKNCSSNLKIIYPLLKFCSILALTPPYNFRKSIECPKSFRYYAMGILILMISGYIYNIYGKRNNEVLKNLDTGLNFVDFVATTFVAIASLSMVITVVFWKPHRFKSLLFNLEKFDNTIRLRDGGAKLKFWTAYITFQATAISTIFADSFSWSKVLGVKVYVYYLPKNVFWYQFSVTTFLVIWLSLEIKTRFREITRLLMRSTKGINCSFLVPTLVNEYSIVRKKDRPFYIKIADTVLLKSIKFWYNDAVKLIEEFNSIFGFFLLFAVLFNIANVVNYAQVLIHHVVYKANRLEFEAALIATSLMWIIIAFLQTLLMAASCEGLSNEARRITKICYTLLSQVPSLPTTDYSATLREELLLLAEQTAVSCSKISAAGFFDVNLGMMGFILASVTSYIIVTIQFM